LDNLFAILFVFIQIIIGINLVLPLILFIFWRFFANKNSIIPYVKHQQDFAIIVTAYQQTDLIPEVVESLLAIDYENYHIYIVADNCKKNENLNFNHSSVSVLYPEQIIASNTGSHFYAINHFVRQHEALMIIDSDNMVDKNILKEINNYFHLGFEAVQGIRAAKNLDTMIAKLDAARDIYYHFFDGKVLFQLGSSATLAGSGMAFTVDLYKKCLENTTIKGAGFDKVLQYLILYHQKRIAFCETAIVYDQKTSQSEQLVNQRSRWINTWFRYFKFGFKLISRSIKNFNFNQFLFGIILLRPPLFLLILLSAIFFLINSYLLNITAMIIWTISFLSFIITFVLALNVSHTDKKIYKALYSIPIFIYYQVISLLNAKNANQRSVATKHQVVKKQES
jgi:cellulose synthase/poly-beta-1,6-N-acetylglucosamine synthase-like glycosyltransferase